MKEIIQESLRVAAQESEDEYARALDKVIENLSVGLSSEQKQVLDKLDHLVVEYLADLQARTAERVALETAFHVLQRIVTRQKISLPNGAEICVRMPG